MMNENVIIYLNNLISKKQNSLQNEELKNKLQTLKIKINNGIFFEIDFDVAVKLLKVIGVPENDIIGTYMKIMSSKNYKFFTEEHTMKLIDVEQMNESLKKK